MNEKELENLLKGEGFSGIFIHTDAPDAYYPEHTHSGVTAHIVLQGEITVSSEGVTKTYRAGERFDVPRDAVHSARVGPSGCRYMIGGK